MPDLTVSINGAPRAIHLGEQTSLARQYAAAALAEREATETAGAAIIADATAAGAAQVALAEAQVALAEAQVALAEAEADRAEAAADQIQPDEIVDQTKATLLDDAHNAVAIFTADAIDHPAIDTLTASARLALGSSRPLRAASEPYPFVIPFTGVTHWKKNGQSNSLNTGDAMGLPEYPGLTMFNGGMNSRRGFNLTDTAALTGGNRASFVPMREIGTETGMGPSLDMMLQLLREEDGVDLTAGDQILLGSAVGVGGQPIQTIASTYYFRYLEDLAAAYAIAESANRSYSVAGILYNGHESNQLNTPPTLAGTTTATTIANFLAVLREFQLKMQTDAQAVSGQSWPVPMFIVQTNTHFSTASGNYTNPNAYVARAQLAAGLNADGVNPNIVFCGPTYQFPLASDAIHFTAEGGAIRDAMIGVAMKRLYFDRVKVKPLVPVATRHRSFVRLTFDTGPFQLQWDTATVPEQVHKGFRVFNGPIGVGTEETINAVRIVGPNVVDIALANTPQPGWEWDYAIATSTGGTRGLGNLRDNQGDFIRTAPDRFDARVDNWVPAQRGIVA